MNEYGNRLLDMSSRTYVEALVDLMKARMQDQHSAESFGNLPQFLSKSWFVVGKYTPRLKKDVAERNFIPEGL